MGSQRVVCREAVVELAGLCVVARPERTALFGADLLGQQVELFSLARRFLAWTSVSPATGWKSPCSNLRRTVC